MYQTVLTILSEVEPAQLVALSQSIKDLKRFVEAAPRPAGSVDPYEPLATSVPDLHFASIMVFEDERYDPLLTVELNFDGDVGPFLPQLETPLLSPYLRAILRCCKRPCDRTAAMYDAVTAANSKMPLAPFLQTLIVKPAVFHQGNRGLTRGRILAEAKLFDTVRKTLDEPGFLTIGDAAVLHERCRAAALPFHPWLDAAPPARIAPAERAMDILKLTALVAVVFVSFVIPGVIVAAIAPATASTVGAAVIALAMVGGAVAVWKTRHGVPAAPVRAPQLPPDRPQNALTFILAGMLIAGVALSILSFTARAALASLLVVGLAAALGVRRLEATDTVHQDPKIDSQRLSRIMALEDQISQNHMGSVVHVKPGIVRAIVIRLGLHGLGLLLRVTATNGFLASMRTIHFAHWALIDNGSRLLFFSNFDSSWESYLDDFIEKAHAGLTLAWSNGIGFPRTRFLVQGGATNGPLFKAWARHSMAESLFWFSAYRNLSVNQIERNSAIADGLRKRRLSGPAAAQWATLL